MSIAPAVAASRTLSRPPSPYVGLVPYGESDAAFFFGRSQEIAIVSANLRASRLTIVYGPSGVGKSSLLQAGVVHGLREEARALRGESPFAVCVVRSWLDDPVRTLHDASRTALEELVGDEALPPAGPTLADSLHAWTEGTGTLLVVLDQFEEYFQYHPQEGDGERLTGFAAELARVVNDPNLAVNVLLSIREDAWAKLDRFEGHVPLLFANYLRVDHLDLGAALEAIEGPIAAWNRMPLNGGEPYEIEPQLVGAVLDAAAGGLTLTAGTEAPTAAAAGDRVEAPFLQLVLERLWRATVADGDRVLTLARLTALGGARKIVENHLLDALGRLTPTEQDAASDCFRFLVSSSRTKIAHPAADLAEWTRRDEAELTRVLEKLCTGESGRILRAVAPALDESQRTSYELFHDILAEPILAWRRAHEQERSRRLLRRRLARIGAVALALVLGFAALAAWALIEKDRAQTQRSRADRLYGNQLLINEGLQRRNETLRAEQRALAKDETKAKETAATQTAVLEELRASNSDLREETADLRSRRNDLDRQVGLFRTQNRELATAIASFNDKNEALAAQIDRLNRRYQRLAAELVGLSDDRLALLGEAGILKRETAALRAQSRMLNRRSDELSAKAEELGYRPVASFGNTVLPHTDGPEAAAEQAAVFAIPGALAESDALRRQVAALERRLARLAVAQARRTDEAAWLRKTNALLVLQRDALRKENEQLEATRAALAERSRTLRETLDKARAEHERLSARAEARRSRNRRTARAVEAQRNAKGALQERNNEHVRGIGDRQAEISDTRAEIRALVSYITPPVARLVQAAQDPAQEPALAGLLGVKAYRVTPFDPDAAAHPGVYNALWIALSRLDAAAARELIAPVAKPAGKLGTTRSAVLVGKICGIVTRGLTREEWTRFLPAGAPYTAKAANPCR